MNYNLKSIFLKQGLDNIRIKNLENKAQKTL